jgi:hypothetical protein
VSFQNGEWILREEQCIRYFRGILKWRKYYVFGI